MIQRKQNYYNKKNNAITANKAKTPLDDIYNKIIPKQKDNRYTDNEFKKMYEKKNKELIDNEQEGTKKRKNNPYKIIITNFDYTKKIDTDRDLIVFKPEDENKESFKEDLKIHEDEIKKQDIENKNIYSEDNKINYTKNFEYVQKYKYKVNIDDNIDGEGDNLRKDRIDFYNTQKINDDKNATFINDIYVDLINKNVLTDSNDDIDLSKFDADELEKKLILQFGKEEYERMMNDIQL